MQRTDVIVLGAGMVGVSAALHLQQRGRSVVLVDRRGPGEETSYGNAGIIQREGVVPYPFPRDIGAHGAVRVQPGCPRPTCTGARCRGSRRGCYRYWRASTPERGWPRRRAAARPLVERCIVEHEALMAEAGRPRACAPHRLPARLSLGAGAGGRARQGQRADRETYGVNFQPLDAAEVAELEPHLQGRDRRRRPDARSGQRRPIPARSCKAYAELFEKRGGRFVQGDARTLEQARDGWQVRHRARARSRPPPWWWRSGPGRTTSSARSATASRSASSAAITMHFRARGQCHAQPAGARCRERLCADADGAAASASRRAPSSPCATRRRRRSSSRASSRWRARSFRWASASMPSPGWAAGPACPTCCPIIGPAPRHRRAVARLRPPSPGLHAGTGRRAGCWPR